MAATNVFVAIRRLPFGYVNPVEKYEPGELQATPHDFDLAGGYYGVDLIAATFGTVTLQKRLPDGSTFVAVGTSTTFSANGPPVVVLLGPGRYRLVIA